MLHIYTYNVFVLVARASGPIGLNYASERKQKMDLFCG